MVGTAGKPSLLGRLGRRHAHLITAACTPSHVDSKAPARPCMNTCPLRTHQGHIRDDEGQPEAAIAAPVDVVGEAGQPLNQRVQRARLQLGNQHLLARITRKSAQRLELKSGDQVFAQIKSVALLSEAGDAG